MKMKTYKNNRENSKSSQGTAGFIRIKWLIIVIIVIIAAATAFGLTIYGKINSNNPGENINTFTVRRDDLIITVTEGGSIKAQKTIQIKNEVDEREMTIMEIVPEGTFITEEDVSNGKILVQLEKSALEDELTQREMDFASAEASYADANESYHIQVNQNESDIAAAQLKVKFALMDFQKYVGEDNANRIVEQVNSGIELTSSYLNSFLEDPDALEGCGAGQKLKELDDSITQTEQNYTLAQDQLEGTEKLHKAQYVSNLELEKDKLNVTSSKLRMERDALSLDLFKRYDFPKQVEQLLSNYNEAKRELERTFAKTRSRIAQAQARLKSEESRFRSRQERLEEAKKDIELCTIKAPAPGLVVYGEGSEDMHRRMRGTGIIAAGETVFRHQTLITLPDLTNMIAKIDVHETYVDKVRSGQKALIIMDAFPDSSLTGEVLKVAPLPNQERGWFNPDLKVYTTEVTINGFHDFLKPGMSSKVEILVNHLKDVIIVPNHVVSNRLGKKICYVMTSGGYKEREVQTGEYNDNFVQILSGLEPGEKVLLSPPAMFEPGVVAANSFEAEINGQAGQEEKGAPTETQDQQERPEDKGLDITKIELTDEMANRMMSNLSQRNPEKAEELKQLQQSDPEKFKAELRKLMQEQMKTFRQERGSGERRQGGSDDMRRRGGNDGKQPESN